MGNYFFEVEKEAGLKGWKWQARCHFETTQMLFLLGLNFLCVSGISRWWIAIMLEYPSILKLKLAFFQANGKSFGKQSFDPTVNYSRHLKVVQSRICCEFVAMYLMILIWCLWKWNLRIMCLWMVIGLQKLLNGWALLRIEGKFFRCQREWSFCRQERKGWVRFFWLFWRIGRRRLLVLQRGRCPRGGTMLSGNRLGFAWPGAVIAWWLASAFNSAFESNGKRQQEEEQKLFRNADKSRPIMMSLGLADRSSLCVSYVGRIISHWIFSFLLC